MHISIDHAQQKRKKRKKEKKKKLGVAEGPSSLTSDLSDISLTDKEKKMDTDQSSDSDGSSCIVEDMPKPAESSSHLSPPEIESARPTQLSASALTTGSSKDGEKSIGTTQKPVSTSTSKAALGVDQQTKEEKVKCKDEGQKSVSAKAQHTPNADIDQNANIQSNANLGKDCQNVEPQKSSSVKVKQSKSTLADQKKTESEKQKSDERENKNSTQPVSSPKPKRYAKTFDVF